MIPFNPSEMIVRIAEDDVETCAEVGGGGAEWAGRTQKNRERGQWAKVLRKENLSRAGVGKCLTAVALRGNNEP